MDWRRPKGVKPKMGYTLYKSGNYVRAEVAKQKGLKATVGCIKRRDIIYF